MPDVLCQAPACTAPVYARDHCSRHYRQLLRHGQVLPDREVLGCGVEGCGRAAVTRGWCHGHYLRWSRTGDVREADPLSRQEDERCSVSGCHGDAERKGLCQAHYRRLVTSGDVGKDRPVRRVTGSSVSHGYRKVVVPAGERWLVDGATNALEHRLVLARALGRPLTTRESVHHRNADRLDNRLANLELWSRHQPTGARASDQVAWAREILERYGRLFPLSDPGQGESPLPR